MTGPPDTTTDAAPDGPTDVPARSWRGALRRTVKEFQEDNLTDWAAALTYYAVLSLFPGLIVLVALLGLVGQYPETFDAVLEIVRQVGPESTVDTLEGPIEDVIRGKGTAGALLGFGLVLALFSASGYVAAFSRAMNAIYEVEEGRPFWKLRPMQMGITIVMVLLLALLAISVVVTGSLAEAVGDAIGLGDTAVSIWSVVKWPVAVVVVMGMFAVLYYTAPNVRHPAFRWVSPGAVLAVILWLAASAGFAVYVSMFPNNKTYGSLGGVIVFLTWLWLTNIAILLGAELDAELERARELEAGMPAEEEIQLPPRQAAKSG